MTINNQNRSAWIKLSYYLFIFLYLATMVLLLYLNVDKPYLIIGIMSAVFLSVIIFTLSLNFNFIIFKETDEKLILRYYPLHPFHDNFKSIEIQKRSLAYFELDNKVFGLKPVITLYLQTEKGIAKYPSVCLSALSKNDREKVILSLKKFGKLKK
ncbi:hypothetical protein GCQ56_16870 [Marinifilum sp. N1E240]|uniref:hypothetical protein n=1 Tax=Marinifilum sp. N1E240 TaxID=2608082 RepID=UPI00128D457D|nr:hypothetical protein [Marinifilum sp. N1E240]MPQ48681.1 hypothetical protein [Marinifilum sp. N1E240]